MKFKNSIVILFSTCVFLIMQGCAPDAPDARSIVIVPENLQVSGPIVTKVAAEGFQVYTLKRDPAGNLAWALKGPDATFSNSRGVTGKHYAGPTWDCTNDGSKVIGKKVADSPGEEEGAVPWLLLSATAHEGRGIFSSVTYIQRINTSGGKAPAVGEAKEGDEVRVAYSADYIFYGVGSTTQPDRR